MQRANAVATIINMDNEKKFNASATLGKYLDQFKNSFNGAITNPYSRVSQSQMVSHF